MSVLFSFVMKLFFNIRMNTTYILLAMFTLIPPEDSNEMSILWHLLCSIDCLSSITSFVLDCHVSKMSNRVRVGMMYISDVIQFSFKDDMNHLFDNTEKVVKFNRSLSQQFQIKHVLNPYTQSYIDASLANTLGILYNGYYRNR